MAIFFSFTDATVLVFTSDSCLCVYKKATEEIKGIKYWLENNLLILNIDKTKDMAFSIDPRRQPRIDENLRDRISEKKWHSNTDQVIKYLGIYIDKYFMRREQINKTASRGRKLICIF